MKVKKWIERNGVKKNEEKEKKRRDKWEKGEITRTRKGKRTEGEISNKMNHVSGLLSC